MSEKLHNAQNGGRVVSYTSMYQLHDIYVGDDSPGCYAYDHKNGVHLPCENQTTTKRCRYCAMNGEACADQVCCRCQGRFSTPWRQAGG